jgi:hypothetical protein
LVGRRNRSGLLADLTTWGSCGADRRNDPCFSAATGAKSPPRRYPRRDESFGPAAM